LAQSRDGLRPLRRRALERRRSGGGDRRAVGAPGRARYPLLALRRTSAPSPPAAALPARRAARATTRRPLRADVARRARRRGLRDRELLLDPALPEALARRGIEPTSFRALASDAGAA